MELKSVKNKDKVLCPTKQEFEINKLKNKIPFKWKMLGITSILFSKLMSNKVVMAFSESYIESPPVAMGALPAINPVLELTRFCRAIGFYILLPITCILEIRYWKKKKTMNEEKQKKNKIIINILLGLIGGLFLLEPIYSILVYTNEIVEYNISEYKIENIIQGISNIFFILGAEFGLMITSKKKYKEIGVILILLSVALYAINPCLTYLICK